MAYWACWGSCPPRCGWAPRPLLGLGRAQPRRGHRPSGEYDRFLLVPGVCVPNLASHVLGQAARRLAADWHQQHGLRPVLAETCLQAPRSGMSYRAAGWQCVGQTGGCPLGTSEAVAPKAVWLLRLATGRPRFSGRRPAARVVCQIISTEMSHIPPLRNDWESGLAWATHSTLGTLKMHRRRPLSTTTGRNYLLQ